VAVAARLEHADVELELREIAHVAGGLEHAPRARHALAGEIEVAALLRDVAEVHPDRALRVAQRLGVVVLDETSGFFEHRLRARAIAADDARDREAVERA